MSNEFFSPGRGERIKPKPEPTDKGGSFFSPGYNRFGFKKLDLAFGKSEGTGKSMVNMDMAEIELRTLAKLRKDAENTESFNRDSDPSSVDIAKLRTLLSLKDAETILAGGVVKSVDFYKERAAELFACKLEEVTDKMRRTAEYYAPSHNCTALRSRQSRLASIMPWKS